MPPLLIYLPLIVLAGLIEVMLTLHDLEPIAAQDSDAPDLTMDRESIIPFPRHSRPQGRSSLPPINH